MTVSAAARKLGVTRQALQKKMRRGSIETRHDNRGNPMIRVAAPATGVQMEPATQVASAPCIPGAPATMVAAPATRTAARARPTIHDAPDMMPVTAHREEIERLQAAHSAALTIHLDLIGRLQAQAAVERSLWIERVDAAELRAERVEQRLDQVLDVLLDNQRRPWWSRLFGASKKSEIGR